MRKNKTWMTDLFNTELVMQTHPVTQIRNDEFWTSDTGAYLNFKVSTQEFIIDTAKINLYNRDDGTLVQRDMTKENNEAQYELPQEIIAHYGKWNAQVVFTSGTERYTSPMVGFEVKRTLGDGAPEKLGIIRDWLVFESDAKELIATVEANELTRQADFDNAQSDRQTEFDNAQSDKQADFDNAQSDRQATFDANEASREASEATRVINEDERKSAEVIRLASEVDRVNAETVRSEFYEGFETILDKKADKTDLNELSSLLSWHTAKDVVGLEVDFENRVFTRLSGAVGLTAGSDFDKLRAFGGRRRCILSDDGKILAYYGDVNYIEDGSLGQVMVEQPKFYYKVVPLKIEPIVDGKGYHLRKARYYVSDTEQVGFKLHPAFRNGDLVNNFIYLSAYEGSYHDVSAGTYNKIDSQDVDFANDMLSSIAGAKPASGLTQSLTRTNVRLSAQNRGAGWNLQNIVSLSMTQLLFIVEYANFNSQNVIGHGVAYSDDGESNMADNTGDTSVLGNKSGVGPNGSVSYRGEENLWMNIWKWIDGYNLRGWGEHKIYVAPMNGEFADNTAENYDLVGFTHVKSNGYISAFGYDEEHDYLFIPTETTGNSSVPVGDYHYQNASAGYWLAVISGGHWTSGVAGGLFSLSATYSAASRARSRGARSVYAAQN